jgi:hypothetical protein
MRIQQEGIPSQRRKRVLSRKWLSQHLGLYFSVYRNNLLFKPPSLWFSV